MQWFGLYRTMCASVAHGLNVHTVRPIRHIRSMYERIYRHSHSVHENKSPRSYCAAPNRSELHYGRERHDCNTVWFFLSLFICTLTVLGPKTTYRKSERSVPLLIYLMCSNMYKCIVSHCLCPPACESIVLYFVLYAHAI